jgi:hypothetical protein
MDNAFVKHGPFLLLFCRNVEAKAQEVRDIMYGNKKTYSFMIEKNLFLFFLSEGFIPALTGGGGG